MTILSDRCCFIFHLFSDIKECVLVRVMHFKSKDQVSLWHSFFSMSLELCLGLGCHCICVRGFFLFGFFVMFFCTVAESFCLFFLSFFFLLKYIHIVSEPQSPLPPTPPLLIFVLANDAFVFGHLQHPASQSSS